MDNGEKIWKNMRRIVESRVHIERNMTLTLKTNNLDKVNWYFAVKIIFSFYSILLVFIKNSF